MQKLATRSEKSYPNKSKNFINRFTKKKQLWVIALFGRI